MKATKKARRRVGKQTTRKSTTTCVHGTPPTRNALFEQRKRIRSRKTHGIVNMYTEEEKLESAHPKPDSARGLTHSGDQSAVSHSSPDPAFCRWVRARGARSRAERSTYEGSNEHVASPALSAPTWCRVLARAFFISSPFDSCCEGDKKARINSGGDERLESG